MTPERFRQRIGIAGIHRDLGHPGGIGDRFRVTGQRGHVMTPRAQFGKKTGSCISRGSDQCDFHSLLLLWFEERMNRIAGEATKNILAGR